MKVRALKTFADSQTHRLGDVYDEDDAVAKIRIKAGLVEKAEEDEKPKAKKK